MDGDVPLAVERLLEFVVLWEEAGGESKVCLSSSRLDKLDMVAAVLAGGDDGNGCSCGYSDVCYGDSFAYASCSF